MNKMKPNSIESVILFILYICMQDGKFSKEESEELIATAPLIQKMYFDFFGEYIPQDLNFLIASVYKNLNSHLSITNQEEVLSKNMIFSKLLTDHTLRDIALLAARNAAGADGLHKNEKKMYEFWYQKWNA
jgi:hypothetical protein